MLYYVSFLIIGLYFMMNFLLANVFNRFKDRLESQAKKLQVQTENLLGELFDKFDYQKKSYLNWQESKEFFSVLFSLTLKRKKHYLALMKLFEDMDCDDFEVLEKERPSLSFFI